MFSWVCPQCGREVPPSKTECPYCAERAQQAGVPPAPVQAMPPQAYPPPGGHAPPTWQPPAPPPPPAPVYQPPQQMSPQATQGFAPVQYAPQYAPPQPQYAQYPPQHQQPGQPTAWPPPQRKAAPPTWLVGGGFALALILVFGGIYYFMSRSDGASAPSAAKTAAAGGAAAAKGVSSPLQRSIEVTGLRFVTQGKNPAVKFLVVNHSGSVVVDLTGTVTVWAGTSRSDEDAIGTFNLNVDNVEGGGSKEMTAPLKTKVKAYAMPDWQNATAEVAITSP
jgi:hypothetical protein